MVAMMNVASLLAVALSGMALANAISSEQSEPPERPSLTVVTFGVSTTAVRGQVANYTILLAERLPSVRFINRGIGGNTTEMARKRFDAQVLAEKPDLTIIQFGINDAAVDLWKTPPATESRVSLTRYEENLRHFIDEIRKGGGEVILMTPNQVRWAKYTLEKYGKPPYNPDDEEGFTLVLAHYAEAARKVAAEKKVTLVDIYLLYGQWEHSSGESCKKLMLDGMHPNHTGHRLVADQLEPLIREKMEK